MPDKTTLFNSSFPLNPSRIHRDPRQSPPPPQPLPKAHIFANTVIPTQSRFAQIIEMMDTTSLLHDDVLDASALRRGAPSAPAAFGTKISVLGGHFVLRRVSAALLRLGDSEVTELIASVLSNLDGEILHKSKTASKPPTRTSSLGPLPIIAPARSVVVSEKSTEDSQLFPVRSVDQPPLLMPSPSRDPQVQQSPVPTH